MATLISAQLDLRSAWKRVKDDIADRVFVKHPYELSIVEHDLDDWFSSIEKVIDDGTYNPKPMLISEVPKPKGGVRPGSILTLADHLVYTALVGACLPAIIEAVGWSQGSVDYAYTLPSHSKSAKWFPNQFTGWKRFNERSVDLLSSYSHVVVADICSYYENIDLSTLISDLKTCSVDKQVISLLSKILNRWAIVQGRGIPQGVSASDVLAKLYMNNVDHQIRDGGYTHIRYVDDIRIFCNGRSQARISLSLVSRNLRARGLNLQSSKSSILTVDEARRDFQNIGFTIDGIKAQYIERIKDALDWDGGYLTMRQAEELMALSIEDTPLDLLKETFAQYFISEPRKQFEKSLFHFLLKRLAVYSDDFAVEYCKLALLEHPEETKYILEYFDAVFGAEGRIIEGGLIEDFLVDFINSPETVYPYQKYLIISWLVSVIIRPGDRVLPVIRTLLLDPNSPPYLRATCRFFFGCHGSPSDLESISNSYPDTSGELEQASIICAIHRMETSRRNTFFGRVENDGETQRRAVRYSRSSRVH